jgi:hypothetical protein
MERKLQGVTEVIYHQFFEHISAIFRTFSIKKFSSSKNSKKYCRQPFEGPNQNFKLGKKNLKIFSDSERIVLLKKFNAVDLDKTRCLEHCHYPIDTRLTRKNFRYVLNMFFLSQKFFKMAETCSKTDGR